MPKRVLDIGVVDDTQLPVTQRAPIRLVESDSITDGRVYVCLSHRWSASGLTLATTQRNYEKHMEGIPLQDLGTVFMDTVHILRRLSVRYLWIDSLCIIQDQGGDWASESTMMAKIYSGAWFTLARQCGASSEISIQDLKARSHKLTNLATPAVDFPLKSRGWVYQERLLSRRVVHFTDREISWECGEAEICQCGWVKRKAHDLYSPKRNHTKALGIGNDVYQPDAHGIRQRWRRMVSEFSPLQLTHISDRLPAIQGCVEQIKEKIRDAYIFGLWRGSLLDDLLWSVHMQTELEQRPPGLWHLPTWSWASVEGGVGY
ncbi:HET-domain-containing protein, partial [Ophiobolus disseminans]